MEYREFLDSMSEIERNVWWLMKAFVEKIDRKKLDIILETLNNIIKMRKSETEIL